MNERTKRLHVIMRAHKLSAADVAAIVDRSPQTVRVWRCASGRQTIPANTLLLLELAVRQRVRN